MRILITNDDGIASPALLQLVDWASAHFTRDGVLPHIVVAAPKVEQSGKSQAIEIQSSIEVERLDVTREGADVEFYSIDSTPADCVRFAALTAKQNGNESFDLVISGINRGYNLGNDIAYSGTCGAIFEASRHGISAVAFSSDGDSYLDVADGVAAAWDFVEQNGLCDREGFLYNVNVPRNSRGIRITTQGGAFFVDWYEHIEGNTFRQCGERLMTDSCDLTLDTDCIRNGYTSVTPITPCKTDLALYESIKHLSI